MQTNVRVCFGSRKVICHSETNLSSSSSLLVTDLFFMALLVDQNSIEATTLSDCKREVYRLRQAEVRLEFERAVLGLRLAELHAEGESPQVSTVLRGGGGITVTRSQHEAAQSQALQLVPEFLDASPIGGEYLQIATYQVTRLEEKNRHRVDGNKVVRLAHRLSADEFRRRLARMIDRIERQVRSEVDHPFAEASYSHRFDPVRNIGRLTVELPGLIDEQYQKAVHNEAKRLKPNHPEPVSYTHLTLPTICSV